MKKIIIAILTLILAAIIGAVSYYYFPNAFNQYKSKILDSFGKKETSRQFPFPEKISSISGIVKGIADDYIIIETEELIFGEKKEIKVIINSNTNIFKEKTIVSAMSGSGELPQVQIQKEPLKLLDIKIGDIISVSSDKNIKDEKEFIASEVHTH